MYMVSVHYLCFFAFFYQFSLSLTLDSTFQNTQSEVQEGIAAFWVFFAAACKVSSTCNPDIQGTEHVDSDLTCKGM